MPTRKSKAYWQKSLMTKRRFRSAHDFRQVTAGPDMPIPERRPDVLKGIQERLDSDGPFLQRYSNGEFISSSIAVARTFEECRGVEVLETPGYTIHHDVEQNLFWRRGGCFD